MEDENELAIFEWFEKQHAWKRLEMFSKLLGKAHPIELQFVSTYLEDLITPYSENLRGTIEFCNKPAALKSKLRRKITSSNDSGFEQELVLAIALMQSQKFEVADILHEYVINWLDDKIKPCLVVSDDLTDWIKNMESFTERDINHCLMMAKMLLIHPNFSVRQKEDVYYRFLLLERFRAMKKRKTDKKVVNKSQEKPMPSNYGNESQSVNTQKTVYVNQLPKNSEFSSRSHKMTNEMEDHYSHVEQKGTPTGFYHSKMYSERDDNYRTKSKVSTRSDENSLHGQNQLTSNKMIHTSTVLRQMPVYKEQQRMMQSNLHHQVKERYSNESQGNYDAEYQNW